MHNWSGWCVCSLWTPFYPHLALDNLTLLASATCWVASGFLGLLFTAWWAWNRRPRVLNASAGWLNFMCCWTNTHWLRLDKCITQNVDQRFALSPLSTCPHPQQVGTLDVLVGLSDELAKLDSFVERYARLFPVFDMLRFLTAVASVLIVKLWKMSVL